MAVYNCENGQDIKDMLQTRMFLWSAACRGVVKNGCLVLKQDVFNTKIEWNKLGGDKAQKNPLHVEGQQGQEGLRYHS